MITTKTLTRTALVLLAGTLAPAAAHAADSITISAPTADDWYAQKSGSKVDAPIVNENGSVSFSSANYETYAWAYFSPVVLDVNEWISFSGTMLFSGIHAATPSTPDGKFLFGIFDANENSQTAVNSMLAAKSSGHGTSLGITSLTSSMTGFFSGTESLAYVRSAAQASSGFLSSGNGSKSANLSATGIAPAAATAYNFSIKVTKTSDGAYTLDISTQSGEGAAVTGTASFSDISGVSQFDVVGFKSPVPAGGSLTLSNFEIKTTGTVIPEPSAFGLLAGAFALALAGTRRRRRR